MDILKNHHRIFNDAFFLMVETPWEGEKFPIWKGVSFRHHPTETLFRAQDKINEYLSFYPAHPKGLLLKGIVLRNLNFNEESILYFQEAKQQDHYLFATNIYLAEYYIHKLKFDEALRFLTEMEVMFPLNKRNLFLLVIVHLELFNFDQAKHYLNQLYQLVDDKMLLYYLNKNLLITEQIVLHTSNRLVLKNFKLKSFNYNLQLKTNLIHFYQEYKVNQINFDVINCFIHGLMVKYITLYPRLDFLEKYQVNNGLNFIAIENYQVVIKIEDIDFEHEFVADYEEYLALEDLMKEE